MSIGEKLQAVAENQQKVYNAGFTAGQATGGDTDAAYQAGFDAGKQTEWDRFWDAYQDNGKRTRYRLAFAGDAWAASGLLPPKYPMKLSTGLTVQSGMFEAFGVYGEAKDIDKMHDLSETCAMIDFSQCANVPYIFADAVAKNITCDFSNATKLEMTFAGGNGGVLENITLKVSAKCAQFNGTFQWQESLTTIRFTEDSEIAGSISFSYSPLSKASIENVMSVLSDTTTGKTATFKKTAVNNAFTTDEWNALVATKPNWTITLA